MRRRRSRRPDVAGVLNELGIPHKQHRDEFWARCPHPQHKEKTPSWSINATTGFHHCFGCQYEGSIIDLVCAHFGDVSFGFAAQWMADHGLWLDDTVPLDVEVSLTRRSSSKLKRPTGLKGGPLESWVTPPKRFVVNRNVQDWQVLRWRILYATDGSMSGRIVIPLRTEGGEDWLSFHARTFIDDERRYKNASEADGFDPGAVFGLEHWPALAIRKEHTLVLTEGSFDALACERAGAQFVGAVGGSEVHAKQFLRLSSWKRVVCATDGDDAGDRLAEQVRTGLARSCEVVRAPMPRGIDANKLETTCGLGALREVLNVA